MVIRVVGKPKAKRPNLFMSTEEAAILWSESHRWGLKWRVMIGLALFRGMRIKEVCNVELRDFRLAADGTVYLKVILCKSKVEDEFPLLPELADLVKEYVQKNYHLMKGGYLFPNRIGTAGMSTEAACALFSKLRNIIGAKHPSFLDRKPIVNDQTNEQRVDRSGRKMWRYRISWHSCRRWFETTFWSDDKHGRDFMKLRDIMRYQDTKSCEPYINAYQLYATEKSILQNVFGDKIAGFNMEAIGQKRIYEFAEIIAEVKK